MVFLEHFNILSDFQEHNTMQLDPRRIYTDVYPFHIFPNRELKEIAFAPITIFYGGNGSGKSTLLNIISNKLNASRKTSLNKGEFFELYVNYCDYQMNMLDSPLEIKTITSDDVFDYLLSIREMNGSVNLHKRDLCNEYLTNRYATQDDSIEKYYEIKQKVDVNRKTMSKYVRERLANNNITEHSNGESALLFWEREINEKSIYILDEPENSLSAENQIKLQKFIEESVRFYNCQFIISTHSPFLLSLEEAKIYDLDSRPCQVKNWTDLPNVKIYYDFFQEHKSEF